MGYTHFWQRKFQFNQDAFKKAVFDFKKLLSVFDRKGLKLAGGHGMGRPELTESLIHFNGAQNCGHTRNSKLIISWPTDQAGGITEEGADAVKGNWLGGALLQKRICDGDCSYESFKIERFLNPERWPLPPDERGLYLQFCKTNFRPYDLAVTVCLVILKHHLDDEIQVSSDGKNAHWWDAKFICQSELGYGLDFRLDDQDNPRL